MILETYLRAFITAVICLFCCCIHSSSVSRSQTFNSDISDSVQNISSVSDVIETENGNPGDSLDFGTLMDSVDTSQSRQPLSQSIDTGDSSGKLPVLSFRYPPYRVGRSFVRISLKQKLTRASFYSLGNVELHQSNGKIMIFRGRLNAALQEKNRVVMESAWGRINIALPCTLVSQNEYNIVDIEENSYRGKMILYNDSKSTFAIVNSLDVEEYLRGVVPLELGRLDSNALEALKAQAVAARTYTYLRIRDRFNAPFDMYPTTADQVYGGFKPEYHDADLAVRLTKDLVLICNDSIVQAYYHSTCGGTTANVEDVWKNRGVIEYLRSESDKDINGRPYCADSKSLKWEETWTKEQFGKIVTNAIRQADTKHQYKPPVKDVQIKEIYGCGRIKMCIISGSGWKYECGGDPVRSVLKRPVAGNPILKSANFNIVNNTGIGVTICGTGHGHGVGMCQTGAIGRARSGQTFDQILRAYYRGIVIRTAVCTR